MLDKDGKWRVSGYYNPIAMAFSAGRRTAPAISITGEAVEAVAGVRYLKTGPYIH